MIKSFYPNSSRDISELFIAIAMWKFPVILPRKVFFFGIDAQLS